MRIESQAFNDERFAELAERCGLADADHARGKMARLWYQCTILNTYEIGNQMVSRVLGSGGVDALIASGLGEKSGRDHIRIKGTAGRIEWLNTLRENGRKGGRPRKDGQSTKPEGYPIGKPEGFDLENQKGNQPDNPLTLTIATALTRSKNPIVPSAGRKPRPQKAKPSDPTEVERASVRAVLEKLEAQNGIFYQGSAEHTRLITARLREGLTEMDLRKVIGYCALELDWKSKPEMAPYLRPETLFGPKTIARYIDAARAWFAKQEGK